MLADQAVIFTSLVDSDDLMDPAIGLTAHLFQEQVPKEFDARITVIASDCFGVAIYARSPAARVDFRADYDAVSYAPLTLPPELPGQLRMYLDRFGLACGAFDFVVTPGGETTSWNAVPTDNGAGSRMTQVCRWPKLSPATLRRAGWTGDHGRGRWRPTSISLRYGAGRSR
jgi:hypothetical protein